MKKILTAIVLFVFAVLPMSVMAMQTITDNELSAVTGQAGVSINVDLTTNLTIGTLAWGDSDGFTGYANAGYVGLTGLTLTAHISGRSDGAFAPTSTTNLGYFFNKPITIDVGTNTSGATLVKIGLPTFQIVVGNLSTNVFLSGVTAGAPTSTAAQVLGSLYIGGMTVLLGQSATPADAGSYDAGYVTIGAAGAGNVGVNIGFNVKIDSVTIGAISWGNSTSILAGSFGTTVATAGYVGLTGLSLGNITIAGGVAIGIGTLNFDAVTAGYTTYTGYGTLGTHTMVNIVIANGTYISLPTIAGTVVLAQNQALTTGAETLGNFYIGGVTAQIVNNASATGFGLSTPSLVQIWAH